MKKIFVIVLMSVLIAGSIVSGCDSANQKVLNAEQKVKDANKDLATAKKEAEEEKMQKEWEQYKSDCMATIATNDNQIAELEKAISQNEKGYNKAYITRVNDLKAENNLIRSRIGEFDEKRDPSTWEVFKTELNRDMNNLKEAFKDLSKK